MDGINLKTLQKYSLIALAFASAAVIFAPIVYFIAFHGALAEKQETWGQFGDFLGGVLNPILSFSSLMALLLTLHLQGKQTAIAISGLLASERESNLAKLELVKTSSLLADIASDIRRSGNAANFAAELSALTATLAVLDVAAVREEKIGGVLAIPRREEIHGQRERIAKRVIELTDSLSSQGNDASH